MLFYRSVITLWILTVGEKKTKLFVITWYLGLVKKYKKYFLTLTSKEYHVFYFLFNLYTTNLIILLFMLWVIPCQINKEFKVTSQILTKLGVFVVPMVLITHANF